MGKPLDSEKMELVKLLDHARRCDGFKCATCNEIDLRLADGLQHATENPAARFDAVDAGLVQLAQQIERIYDLLEGSPIPKSFGRSIQQLVEFITLLRQVIRLPVTRSVAAPARRPSPPPRLPPAEAARLAERFPVRPMTVEPRRVRAELLPQVPDQSHRPPRPPRTPVLAPPAALLAQFARRPPRTPVLAA